ncbi:REDY-like protein HapK [Altererythrobacter confluentis]|uniref:REDY-like protein HapK n=1 Tax=Allopontixanthobacter confluentis TaxID=1849021 RepID=A0A6L7GCI0_9SPHN|nr:REDY-like protein HapK [Allopontixanthobacter confluentis]MXP13669.1 REDY-like protein HapK [Allopontixanthobacter confluentis]
MRIIALFNLKQGARRGDYESWAKGRDIPTTTALPSVSNFEILRTRSVLFSEAKPPFDYVEIIDASSMAALKDDLGGDAVAALKREMAAFTEDPIFIVTEKV